MGCEGCARAILLVFNILFFLIGAAALGVGIWVLIDGKIFLELLGNIPNSDVYGKMISEAAYVLVAAGGVIFLIAFFGCCGAWKKNKCMLVTYAVIIGILLTLQIATVVVAYFFYDKVIGVVNENLAMALNSSYDSTFTAKGNGKYDYGVGNLVSKGIDAVQIQFKCCGVNNYTDYAMDAFPPTCCPSNLADAELKTLVDTLWKGDASSYTINDPTCHGSSGNTTVIENVKGCSESITDYVKEKSMWFMIIGGAALGIQLLVILLACCLFCAIRNEEQKA